MIKNLVFVSMILALTACTTEQSQPQPANDAKTTPVVKAEAKKAEKTPALKNKAKECICTRMWMPVCGENNKTYGNSCEADCAGVKYTEGACKDKLQDV